MAKTVLDLYAGTRDAAGETPLGPDDLFNVWSTTKGLAALAGDPRGMRLMQAAYACL